MGDDVDAACGQLSIKGYQKVKESDIKRKKQHNKNLSMEEKKNRV